MSNEPKPKTTAQIYYELCDPFKASQVSWRIGSTNKKSQPNGKATKGQALCYIDARDVMGRLDSVVGCENWRDEYQETNRGRTFCTLSIRINGEWISKTDGAGDSETEGEKGSISDALKRAAVKWGIGRYLYAVEAQWVAIDEWGKMKSMPTLPAWAMPGGLQKAPELKYTEQEKEPEEPPKPKAPDGLAVAVKWGSENVEHISKCGVSKQWHAALDGVKMDELNKLKATVVKYKKENGL